MKNAEATTATRTAKLGRNPFEKKQSARVLKTEHSNAPADTHSAARSQVSGQRISTPWRFAQGVFYWVMGATLECVATRLQDRASTRD